jgi:hypothetical protein
MPSCRRAVLLPDVRINSQTGKEQLPAHAAGKRKIAAVPVEIVSAHPQPVRGFLDREQFVGPERRLSGGSQAGYRRAPDLLKIPEKSR